MLLTESKSGSMIRQQVQQEANRLCELHDLGTVKSEKGRWNRGIWSLPPRFFILVIVSVLTFWTFYLLIRPDVTLIVLQMFVAFVSSVFLILYSSDYPSRYSRRFSYERGLIIIKCKDEQIISSDAINWSDISVILHETIEGDGILQDIYKLQKHNGDIFPMLFYDNSIKHIEQMI